MKVHHHKMSLFDAPKGSCLIHACNAMGVWRSGIAVEFSRRFPNAYTIYRAYCSHFPAVTGDGLAIRDKDFYIGCLITSKDFGCNKDQPEVILAQTATALDGLLRSVPHNVPLYSCKFNSGLFQVEWSRTEKLLLDHMDERDWHVCDPT